MHEPTVAHAEPRSRSTTHIVHALVQFGWAVRHRKEIVIGSLAAAVLLAMLYYATATRYYEATAELFILQSGADMMNPAIADQGTRQQGLMPTYENLLTSAEVLKGALDLLNPEDRVDMADAPSEKWAGIIRRNLEAKTLRNTNIIEISYQSKDPQAAVAVVNAVVDSYREFMARTHRGTTDNIIQVFTQAKTGLAAGLAQKEQELLEARNRAGAFGMTTDSKTVHPVVQRVIDFNEALTKVQLQRTELEASLHALEAAVRNGDDLQQHVMGLAKVVGQEILLSSLGVNPHDAGIQAQMERALLEDKATLQAMQEHLGEAHPAVGATIERIRMTQDYLDEFHERVKQRVAQMQNTELGPTLVAMIQQELTKTCQLEASLQSLYEQAHAEALLLNNGLAQIEILERELQRSQRMYDTWVERIAKMEVTQPDSEIRSQVVSEPQKADRPVSPNLRRALLMALVGGMGVGLLVVYMLDVLDDHFRCAEEMQNQLGVPVLAMIRELGIGETAGLDSLQMHVAPDAPESEAFRTLRTTLALAEQETRRIVVSSAEPGDGKTTVLTNLAVCCAQSEKRTLLIDADLRRPRLTAMLQMRTSQGLSDVIRGTAAVEQMASGCIRGSGIEGLDVLPSGPRPTNPAEMLANPRFFELLAWAETVYDQILIDSPPALATSDTAVIGRLVDGVVLVVQPDKNHRRQVIRVAESFAALKVSLLGVVVNRLNPESDRGYYGYDGGYAYDYAGEELDDGRQSRSESTDVIQLEEPMPPGGIVPRRVA